MLVVGFERELFVGEVGVLPQSEGISMVYSLIERDEVKKGKGKEGSWSFGGREGGRRCRLELVEARQRCAGGLPPVSLFFGSDLE